MDISKISPFWNARLRSQVGATDVSSPPGGNHPLLFNADNIMAYSQAIKSNSIKMREIKRVGATYVTCLITSPFLDQDEPMELFFSNIRDLRTQLESLTYRHFPVQFEIDTKYVCWLSNWVFDNWPSKMLLFLCSGSWSQFYTEPTEQPCFKVFSRRALKKSFKLTTAKVHEDHTYSISDPTPSTSKEVVTEIEPESIELPPEKEVEEEDGFSELEDYLKDKVFSNPVVNLSTLASTKLGKPAHQILREYKYVCRLDDLNDKAPGYEGMACLLTYMAIKSKMKRMSLSQRLAFEEHLRVEASKVVDVKDEPINYDEDISLDNIRDGPINLPEEQMAGEEKTVKSSQGAEKVDADKHGNVALTTQREESKPEPPVARALGFLPHSSAKEKQTLEQLTDRWIEAANFKWATSQVQGTDICSIQLPLEALAKNRNSPNIAPFNIHEYARFDMKIRLQVNSNKFQIGQLQGSWFYNNSCNARFEIYDNIYSASQRIHGLVSAGASNDVVIDVPYWALTSAIALKSPEAFTDFATVLDLGRFSVKVLNQLKAAEKVSSEADCTVWVTFSNIEFRGMKASNLGVPFKATEQMNEIEEIIGVAKTTVNLVDNIYSQLSDHSNTDNPPASVQPLPVQPVASHSFCVTKGQPNVAEIMRADPNNQTPVVPGSSNKMTNIRELLSIWSLIRHGKWTSGTKRGEDLFSEYTVPPTLTNRVKTTDPSGKIKLQYHSILSFLYEFFGMFRGEIELRFDFIANEFYSGRVGCFTIPGIDTIPAYEDARQSAGAVFDLQEGHQFIYKIPFYSNTPFIRAQAENAKVGTEFLPSAVVMYVLNTLKVSDNIPSEIEFNVYVRGTPSFEFALLKTPTIATFFNDKVILPTSQYATVDPNWAQCFTSGSRWLSRKDGKQNLSLFYNETTDYFTQFLNLKEGKVYTVPNYVEVGDNKYMMVWIDYYKPDKSLSKITHLVKMYEYPSYPVVVCFDSLELAKKYASDKDRDGAPVETQQGDWIKCRVVDKATRDAIIAKWPTSLTGWRDMTATELVTLQFPESDPKSDDFVMVQSDETEEIKDERLKKEMPAYELAKASSTTNYGKLTFGETETSIIGMCKRYQFLGCQVITTEARVTCLSNMTPSLKISTHPVRRFKVRDANDRDNETREGFISTLASMYAGYRGSMRYRLILSDLEVNSTASIVIVHRYMDPHNPQNESVHVPVKVPGSFANLLDTSYATKLQCSTVNPVVEFEVPFYNITEYNSLYPPPASNARLNREFMESGEIWVYISTVKEIKIAVDVFYAVGDDMEFSCFQGIPQCVNLLPLAQSDEAETIVTETVTQPNPSSEPQGLIDNVKNFISNVAKVPENVNKSSVKLGTAADVITNTVEETTSGWSKLKKNCLEGFSAIVNKLPTASSILDVIKLVSSVGGILCSAVVQLLYVLIDPSPWSIAIACASIACLIVGVSTSASKFFGNLVLKVCSLATNYLSTTPTQQNKESDQEVSSMVSILWSIVLGSFSTIESVKKIQAPNFSNITSSLFSNSGNIFRTHNFGIKFFNDFISCIRRMYQYVNKFLARDYPVFNIVQSDELRIWMIESLAILEKFSVTDRIRTEDWSAKLYELQAQGAIIAASARASLSVLPAQSFQSLMTIQRNLTTQVEALKQTNCFAPFRREPFVIWLYSSKGGSGKSTYATALPSILGKEFGIRPDAFQITPGQKYFDGLTTEKFMIIDDFLATSTADSGELLAQYLQMVGTGRLQLPRAALEKKLTYDDFEFIIITSNFSDFQSENAAKCKSAFERRRHVVIEFEGDAIKNDVIYYHIEKKTEVSSVKKKMDYDEMTTLIIEEARKHRAVKDALYKKQIDQYFDVVKNLRTTQSVTEYIEEFKSQIIKKERLFESFEWIDKWFSNLFKNRDDVAEKEAQRLISSASDIVAQTGEQGIITEINQEYNLEEIEVDIKHQVHEVIAEVHNEGDATPEEILESLENDDTPDEPSIFLDHPYAPSLHQRDFKINFSCIQRTIFSNIDGTTDAGVCNCFILDHPLYYRFNEEELDKWLARLIADDRLTENKAEQIRELAKGGLFVGNIPNRPVTSWGFCVRAAKYAAKKRSEFASDADYEKFIKSAESRCFRIALNLHQQLAYRSWTHLWHIIKTDKYKFEDIYRAIPHSLHYKVQELEKINGWKLVVSKEHIGTMKSQLRQLFGLWPKLAEIGHVFHPFPLTPDQKIVRKIANETFMDRFRITIGAVPVEDKDRKDIWLYPWWMALLKGIGTVLSILVLLSCLGQIMWGVVSLFKISMSAIPGAQMLTSGTIGTGKLGATKGIQARTLLGATSQDGSQMTVDELENLEQCVSIQGKPMSGRLRKVLKNVCFMVAKTSISDNQYKQVSHRCLGLVNSKVIVCRHYLDHFQRLKDERGEAVKFYLVRPKSFGTKSIPVHHEFYLDKINKFEFGVGNERVGDMMVVDFLKMPSSFSDIRSQIPTALNGCQKYPTDCVLISGNIDNGLGIASIKTTYASEPMAVYSKDKKTNWLIGSRLVYNAGGDGVCGSLVWNEKSQYPLLGFHTAGVGIHFGFSELLLQEEMFPKDKSIDYVECNMDMDETLFDNLEGKYEPVGTIPSSMRPHIPRSSRIVPSEAHGLFETRTEPAPLAKKDPRLETEEDPLMVGLKKRCHPMIPFDPQDLAEAREVVLQKFYTVTPSIPLRKLTRQEAIEGIRSHPRSEPIEMSTSEGYPWIKLRPKGYSDKRWLFDLETYEDGSLKCVGIDPFLEGVLNMKEIKRRQGLVPLTYYTAMLKDARILKSKVSIPGKTRVFEMSPIDLTIAQRQFQTPFILTYMDNNLFMENTVGINVNGREWNDLAYSLLNFSPHILAGDYSSYGPRIDLNVLDAALGIIKDWSIYYGWNVDVSWHNYSTEDMQEFHILNEEIITSPLVCERLLLRPAAGMASGNAATVIINSIVNSLYIRCAFLELAREYDTTKSDLSYFDKYVKMFSNGDDVIISVKEEIIDWFNNHTLGQCFERHDLKFTNSKKDGSNPKFETIDQVTYLKCFFKPHPARLGYFMAALDKVSIEDCCQWVWRTEVDFMSATIENCIQTVRLAYGHGPEYYNYIKRTIERFFLSRSINTVLPTWRHLDQLVWETDEVVVRWM